MRLSAGHLVLILVLLSSYSVHARVVKRQANNTSVDKPPGSGGPQTSSLQKFLQGIISFVKNIPIIGGLLTGLVERLVQLILALELLTNGAIARLLGGALPCKVSLDEGFQCSGISRNGGISQLLINVIDSLPNLLLPQFIKDILKMMFRGLLDPIIDVLFGGQTIRS